MVLTIFATQKTLLIPFASPTSGTQAYFFKTEFTGSSSNKKTKTLYQDYLNRIANFTATVLNIFSKKKSFVATPNVENKCWTSHESLESTDEMKLMMKFYLCLQDFKIYFLSFPREIVFGVISGNYLYLKL